MAAALFGGVRARLSLRTRVGLVLFVAVAAFVAVFLWASLSSRGQDLRQELRESGRTSLSLIERTVAEQAVIGDYSAIQQALEAGARRPDVDSVSFVDERGGILTVSNRESHVDASRWAGRLLLGGAPEPVEQEVRLGGHGYGVLRLEMDPYPTELRLHRAFVTQASVSAVAIVVVLVLTWIPLRANLRFLLRLQEAAQRFEAGDHEARVAALPSSAPELRRTAEAFNAMGDRIEALVAAISEERRAVDAAAIILETDLEGRITSANRRFAESTGRPNVEVFGRLLADVLEEGSEVTTPGGWAETVAGRSFRGEVRVEPAGGATVWLDLAVTPIRGRDGRAERVLVIGFDVTAERLASEELRQSRQMLRLVLDNIPQLVFWKDRDSIYLGCNRNFSSAAGRGAPEEVIGLSDLDLPWSETEAESYRQDDRQVMETGEPKLRFVETQLMADGRLAWVETSKVPLHDAAGNVVGVLGTYEDVTDRRIAEKRIEYLAFHDGLTGLPNRSLLEDRLSQAIATSRRHGKTFAVLFVDLDGFKGINDRLGHEPGDELLKEMAHRLLGVVREGDTVARLGGDEFVLLLLELGSREDVATAVGRVLDAVRVPTPVGDVPVSITASVGVSLYPADGTDGDALLRYADVAMYHAKERGRDGYQFFDREMARAFRGRHRDVERIRRALADGELFLVYQPTVNMRTGAVVGAEALIRWQEPGRGVKLPAEFLPEIEESDLIVDVGTWVLEEALARAESWQAAGLDLRIGVNVAARQIQHPGFLATLEAALARHPGVPRSRLDLEILETTALDDVGLVQGVMTHCRESGVRFCLDDFGTGYSSLSYLKRLPVDVVKIDQGFVRDMLEDREDLAIVEGILSMAAIFGREVIAEGVSTVAHGAELLRHGCELAQGYGIARPMPGDEIPGWIQDWIPDPSWARTTTDARRARPAGFGDRPGAASGGLPIE